MLILNQPAAAAEYALDEELLKDGWISLFDGTTLLGWHSTGEADWRVEDGTIAVSNGDVCLLRTTSPFADFELSLELRAAPTTNSGIFFRSSADPQDPAADCYELNIAGADNPFPTGSLVARRRVDGVASASDWVRVRVVAVGAEIEVFIGGVSRLQYTDPYPISRGYIGLQHNQGEVAFRKIRLRPLGLQAENFADWKSHPEMTGRFVREGRHQVNLAGGPGQFESKSQFGDFALQVECATHAPGVNSGIFFRCIPGDKTMGYESQIHNGYQEGDRNRPANAGTGAIFRRQEARRVVADDGAWFYTTIVATGPHFAVWVNGLQVTDWLDDRPEDANPRRGKRLAPGTLMLQAHDPSADVTFRNLRVAETPQR